MVRAARPYSGFGSTDVRFPWVRIVPLTDCPQVTDTLARWHGVEWADLFPGWSYQTALDEFAGHSNRDRIPLTLVALDDDEPLGSASLIVEDLPGWEHLTPWLASVFVRPPARGRGVARALIREIEANAQRLGVERLHLFTGGQVGFYQKLGWRELAPAFCQGHAVTVMYRDLGS